MRGTVRFGLPRPISLPTSQLKTGTQIVAPDPQARRQAQRGLGRDDGVRPAGVRAAAATRRCTATSSPATAARTCSSSSARCAAWASRPGAVDGRYDGSTAAGGRAAIPRGQIDAVRRSPRRRSTGSTPPLWPSPPPTDNRCRRASRCDGAPGASRADVNQARIDAASVAESLPTARAAINAARARNRRGARPCGGSPSARSVRATPAARRDLAAARSRRDGQAERAQTRRPARATTRSAPSTPCPRTRRRSRGRDGAVGACASQRRRSRARAPTSPPLSGRRTAAQNALLTSRHARRATTAARRGATSRSPRSDRREATRTLDRAAGASTGSRRRAGRHPRAQPLPARRRERRPRRRDARADAPRRATTRGWRRAAACRFRPTRSCSSRRRRCAWTQVTAKRGAAASSTATS